MSTRLSHVLLATALLIALVLRLVPLPGWPESDSQNYAAVAWSQSPSSQADLGISFAGPPHDPSHESGPPAFAIRPGLTAPVALAIWLLGFNPIAFFIVPLVFGVLEVLLAFLWGRLLVGNFAGAVAALIVSVLPVCVGESRHIKADQPAATLLYLAVFVALFGFGTARNGLIAGLCAGFLAFWACLTKETTGLPLLAIALVSAPVLVVRRKTWPAAFGVATAFVLSAAAELVFYSQVYGDPLHRFHEVSRNFVVCSSGYFTADSAIYGWKGTTYAKALVERLFIIGPRTLLIATPALGVPLAAFAFCAVTLLRGVRGEFSAGVRLACCYLMALFLMFNFVTTATDAYRPMPPVLSYFYPIVLPSAVLVGVAAAHIAIRSTRAVPVLVAGICAFLVASGGASTIRSLRDDLAPRELDSIAETLARTSLTCYTDPRTAFELYQRVCETPLPCDRIEVWDSTGYIPAGSLVLIRSSTIEDLTFRYSYKAPDIGHLEQTSRLVASGRTFRLLVRGE